jgi:hypothetical protein
MLTVVNERRLIEPFDLYKRHNTHYGTGRWDPGLKYFGTDVEKMAKEKTKGEPLRPMQKTKFEYVGHGFPQQSV